VKKNETKYLMTWDEAFHAGADMAGGKGWGLARLACSGFRVPVGRVLATKGYTTFLRYNDLQEPIDKLRRSFSAPKATGFDEDDRLAELREKITKGAIPSQLSDELSAELAQTGLAESALAVRSSAIAEDSANASFAGIHASSLQVIGLDNVFQAVKNCYASLWTSQAVAYRRKMNIAPHQTTMAVVIMKMVEARAAGVGFTCDPQTGRRDILVINANFGLGESVVNGTIDPDTYYLDGKIWHPHPEVISKKIGKKQGITRPGQADGIEFVPQDGGPDRQVLTDRQIERLGLLLQRVLEASGDGWRHQDVEWVFDGREFAIVQARPVTALIRRTFAALRNQPDIWSNGNYRDSLPMVLSPLSRRFMEAVVNAILHASFEETGYRLPVGLQFSRFFQGRLYCNLSALQWAYFDTMGSLPRDVNIYWGGHQPEIEIENPKPFRGMIGLKRIWRGLCGFAAVTAFRRKAPEIHDLVLRAVASITSRNFADLRNEELMGVFAELGGIVRDYARKFSFLSAAGSMPMAELIKKLVRYFPDRAFTLANGLMIGGESAITSAEHGYRLLELAGIARRDNDAVRFFTEPPFVPISWRDRLPEASSFKRAFQEFLEIYGHRAVYELDIINPRWNEDPTYLLEIIQAGLQTADLQAFREKQREKCRHAWREVDEKVPARRRATIRKLVKSAQAGAAIREQTKSVLARLVEAYRMLARELGDRLQTRGLLKEQPDIYFCTWPELVAILSGEWDGLGIRDLIAARKAARLEMEALKPPDVIFDDKPQDIRQTVSATGNKLPGVAVASGKATGTARHINHPVEGRKLQTGEIIVAPATDPGWTPLFLQAGALIMETGGFLSHGAIVAREYGIPAVTNVPGVLRIVHDGMEVTVDGDQGMIFLH
jgi:rifampicin phosphotransferase